MKNNSKVNIRRVLCLMLLVLASFSSYLLARYVSNVSGHDQGTVARWAMDIGQATPGNNTVNLVSGNQDGTYYLTVSSYSQVAGSYSITVWGIPIGVELELDNDGDPQTSTNGTITFDNVGSFAANDPNNSHTHSLTFYAPLGVVSQGITGQTINIRVEFTQID